MDAWQSWEIGILDFLYHHHTAWGDWFFSHITRLGDGGIVWILLTICLLLSVKYRRLGVMLAIGLILGAGIVNVTLKPLIARTRPYEINTAVQLLVAKQVDYSFPSGHTMASFVCAVILLMKEKRFGIPALILAILIAFSRLYLYVHFPTDVLFSMILGIIVAVASIYIYNLLERWHYRRKDVH